MYQFSSLKARIPIVVVLFNVASLGSTFYLPGIVPTNFCTKENSSPDCQSTVDLFVNRLNSRFSTIAYDYDLLAGSTYNFCDTPRDRKTPRENLGQVLMGSRIKGSPYRFTFRERESCKQLCVKQYPPGKADYKIYLEEMLNIVRLDYRQHWIIDNVPVAYFEFDERRRQAFGNGFPVGCYVDKEGKGTAACTMDHRMTEPDTYYLFNHLKFVIEYHQKSSDLDLWTPSAGSRIIAVQVYPRSLNTLRPDQPDSCGFGEGEPLRIKSLNDAATITYSYSVDWKPTNVSWSSRWDHLLNSRWTKDVQWMGIFTSLAITALLCLSVGMILARNLTRDMERYNNRQVDADMKGGMVDDLEEDETGWKLIHGDVFRNPRLCMLLSVFLGTGSQLLTTMFLVLFIACIGFLSPANRGALMTCAILFYVGFGVVAGYVSAFMYKTFGGENWKGNVMWTGLLCPGLCFFVFFVINLLLWGLGSSGAIPFTTLIVVVLLWLAVNMPLTLIGSKYGFRRQPLTFPCRTNMIPRHIPEQNEWKKLVFKTLFAGLLPFACIAIQLYFILNSIWAHHFYYMFGFLGFVYCILIATCAGASILMCYNQICLEDYRWWWRSFLNGGSIAVYVFAYSLIRFNEDLEWGGVASITVFYAYTLIITFIVFLMTGTIGFFACLWFMRKIYGSIKVD